MLNRHFKTFVAFISAFLFHVTGSFPTLAQTKTSASSDDAINKLLETFKDGSKVWDSMKEVQKLWPERDIAEWYGLRYQLEQKPGVDAETLKRIDLAFQLADIPVARLRFHLELRRELDAVTAAADSLLALMKRPAASKIDPELQSLLRKRVGTNRAAVERLEFTLASEARYHRTYKRLGMKVNPVIDSGPSGEVVLDLPDEDTIDPAAPKPAAPATDAEALQLLLEKRVLRATAHIDGYAGAVLIAHKGHVLLHKGFGLADAAAKKPIEAHAVFDWASVAKQFTAAAALKLAMEKKLSLDDTLVKFFPKAPEITHKIQVRHLLHHTSGLTNEREEKELPMGTLEDREKMAAFLLRGQVVSEPGSDYAYNNMGYILAAAIIEKAAGVPFEEYCIERLFKPAGMMTASFIGHPAVKLDLVPKMNRGTGAQFAYSPKLNWGYRGAGGALASVEDFLKWDRALRGTSVLSAEAKSELFSQPKGRDSAFGYALGWEVYMKDGELWMQHSGNVDNCASAVVRTEKSEVLVALTCTFTPDFQPQNLAIELANLVLEWR